MKALKRWRIRNQSMRALHGLSDAELSELGILRADIPTIVDDLLSSQQASMSSTTTSTGPRPTLLPLKALKRAS